MASELTTRLNAQAENRNVNGRAFNFLIHSNEGNFRAFLAADNPQRDRSTILINGVLGEQVSTPLPLQGLGSTLITQTLMFAIPIDKSLQTGRADYAIQAINAFVQDVAGLSGTLQDPSVDDDPDAVSRDTYAYVLSVSTPYVGQEENFVELGRVVPVTCQVSWQFIKDGVLANNVNMTLNGTPVTLLDGVITRTRTGDAVNVQGSQEMKTAITQQGIVWRVVMPYKRGDISQTLYQDMLTGSLETKYILYYDDRERDASGNVITNARGFYVGWQVVAKEISAATTAGKGITLTALLTTARE